MFARRLVALLRSSAAAQPLRRMGGGGHGHGPAKTLPPRPQLGPNPTFGQRIEHAMWEKRNPDFNGIEAIIRYYLPQGYHVVYAILGLYAAIAGYGILKSNISKAAALAAEPKPSVLPDYHTPIVSSSDVPEFGSPEFEKFVESGAFEKYINGGAVAKAH